MTGEENELSVLYLRSMAFAPFFASLNVVNVFELLYKGDNKRIFIIAVLLLITSVALTIILITTAIPSIYGYYLTAMDLIALFLYLYFANKDNKK
jgi:O-antigen/teichoic acid export membrane protein